MRNTIVSVSSRPSSISARVSYHGHFREHGHYRGQNTPYTSRPWITIALSLRFNDALTYREIAEQLKVSSSATHKMFKRFRRTGINWPLPEDYTPERLEEELYAFNLETNLPVKKRRPDWPLEFKIRMAELSLQPDACVAQLAQLAREHGVNDNLVFNWRNLHRQGLLDPAARAGVISDDVRARLMHSFSRELGDWRRGALVMVICETEPPETVFIRKDGHNLPRSSCRIIDAALMTVSPRYIPLDSRYEGMVEARLWQEKRTFVKPLRYDGEENVFPDFVLTDVSGIEALPMEVYGMNTPDYLQRKQIKMALYDRDYGAGRWWQWDASVDPEDHDIPAFPHR